MAAKVNALLSARGWSGRELARRAGMPPASMTRKLAGLTAIDVDDLAAIAAALEVQPSELLPHI